MKINQFFQNKYFLLADQALYSLLNFGSVFLLSKLTSIPVFADFVLVYSYANLIFIFITYFISSPILVFLPKKWGDSTSDYFSSLLVILLLSILGIYLLSFSFVYLQVPNTGFWSFFGMIFGMVLYDVLKKFIYAGKKMSFIYTALSSSFLVLCFFSLILLFREKLSINFISFIYFLSFGIANLLLILFIHQHRLFKVQFLNLKVRIIFKEHFKYSKWIIAGGFLFWVYSQGVYLIADILGIDDLSIGKVRTIQNLLGLFSILIISMESYYIPIFSSQEKLLPQPVKDFYKKFKFPLILLLLVSLPVLYLTYNWFYEGKYGDGTIILLIIWCSQFLTVMLKPLSMALKAMEITFPLFMTHIAAIISLLTLGVLFIYLWENLGIALAIFTAFLSSNIILFFYYKKLIR